MKKHFSTYSEHSGKQHMAELQNGTTYPWEADNNTLGTQARHCYQQHALLQTHPKQSAMARQP